MNNLFLKEDHERVETLLSEFDRYINLAKLELSKNNHDKALQYAEHATKMVAEIRALKNVKRAYDESREIKKQAKLQDMTNHMLEQRRLWF